MQCSKQERKFLMFFKQNLTKKEEINLIELYISLAQQHKNKINISFLFNCDGAAHSGSISKKNN